MAPMNAGTLETWCARQKPSYFDIGIHSILDLAIELQEKFVVKEHGGIALLHT